MPGWVLLLGGQVKPSEERPWDLKSECRERDKHPGDQRWEYSKQGGQLMLRSYNRKEAVFQRKRRPVGTQGRGEGRPQRRAGGR